MRSAGATTRWKLMRGRTRPSTGGAAARRWARGADRSWGAMPDVPPCQELLADPLWPPPPSTYPFSTQPPLGEPLLAAIGGLDYADRPIAVTRPGSLGSLAALAFQGVAWADGETPPQALTGTSMAAAVAGGATAAVWSYLPELRADEVLDLLQSSSQALGQAPDPALCIAPSCSVRRISLCDALAAVCALDDAKPQCPSTPIECAPTYTHGQNPPWPSALESKVAAYFAAAALKPAAVSTLEQLNIGIPAEALPSSLQGVASATLVWTVNEAGVLSAAAEPIAISY